MLAQSGRRLYWLDATSPAIELGGPILLNMIMLGALCGLPDFPLEVKDLSDTMKDFFPESKREVNNRALDKGASLIKNNEN